MKTILVTGATDGIGRAAAARLGRAGTRILVHGRTMAKAEAAAKALANETGGVFAPVAGDFARLDEVRALAADVVQQAPRLDALVNNAGIFTRERLTSDDGFELTLAVNHLAPFALTHLLLPSLLAAGAARVVNVSSMVHMRASIDWDDLDRTRDFDGYAAYGGSKLMNVLFTYELARRLDGRGVTVNAMHPGVIGTKLLRQGFGSMGGDDADAGGEAEAKLAADPALEGVTGRYYDQTEESRSSRDSHDGTLQQRCYEMSLARTGVAPA
ncbi:MAG: putative oxidoreductase [Myxococcales bacterium]|nr:putative oxidoreductase [Myxococcales bacterium]